MTVTIEEAKDRIEELAQLAASGQEVLIMGGDGVTLALKASGYAVDPARKQRIGGQWAGLVTIGPDFDDPMPDEWLDLFYNGRVFPEPDVKLQAESSETDRH